MNRIVSFVGLLLAIELFVHCANAQDVTFRRHVLSREHLSEGAAVADINNDDQKDIIAGSYWFEGPDWTPHAFRSVKTFPDTTWGDSFFNHVLDVNQDGWTDILRIDFPGKGLHWYENPGTVDRHWVAHAVHPSVNNESPRFVDVDDDGRDDVLFADGTAQQMVWLSPPEAPGDTVWTRHLISDKEAPGTSRFAHGLGRGDVNGDGRPDVIVRQGWWQASTEADAARWTFHEADLGEPAAQMYTYDVDGDGDQDVVASSAHDYGIWWYEQHQDPDGDVLWTRHLIHDAFSQTHGLALRDINGDGLPDLVTGKRYFAHNGKDPGGHEPPVLYWFELTRSDGEPRWVPHPIDDDSGVGVEVVVDDVNGDGRPDIITANKKGVFYFEQL